MNLAVVPLTDIAAGCGVAIVMCLLICHRVIGGDKPNVVADVLMIALTEMVAQIVFRTPLFRQYLDPRNPVRSSWIVGSGLALVGIILNHLASRNRFDRGKFR